MTPLETALASWLAFHAGLGVDLESELNPGADDAALDRVEAAIGRELPEDLRALYRVADGQADPWAEGARGGEARWAAMFGRERFLSLDEALAEWRFWHDEIWLPEQAHGGFSTDQDVREGDPVDPVYWKPGWFTFAGSDGGNGYAVDLDPPRGGTYGQVVVVGSDEWERRVVASSVTELLARASIRLDPADPHRFVREDGHGEGDRPTLSFDMDWRVAPSVPPSAEALAAAAARDEAIAAARRAEREEFERWMASNGVSPERRAATLRHVGTPLLESPFGPRDREAFGPPQGAVPTNSWMAEEPLAWLAGLDAALFVERPFADATDPGERAAALDALHRWRVERGDWSELDYRRSRAVLERPRPPVRDASIDDRYMRSMTSDGDRIVVERDGPDGRERRVFPSFGRLMDGVR